MPARLLSIAITLGLSIAVTLADDAGIDAALRPWQGTWRLVPGVSTFHTSTWFPTGEAAGTSLEERMSTLRVDRTSLTMGDAKVPVQLQCSSGLEGVTPPPGTQLAILTYRDGTEATANYRIDGETLTLRYPHTATCSRSGSVAVFMKVRD